METIDRIFDLLDDWRHLPDYQLERRADVFFAACLPKFLSHRLQLDIRPSLIPEFPVRIGTIDPASQSNQSKKIDYVALDASGTQAVFVELKTDSTSRRDVQDYYYQAAKSVGVHALLDGILKIVCASKHKHKYCHLLRLLERHRLIELPSNLDAALQASRFASAVNACIPNMKITAANPTIQIVYVQPIASRSDEIGFEELAAWVETRGGELAERFSASLRRWADSRAGYATSIKFAQ